MSNYVKSTNFATKDSLASGNPAKLVKEQNSIQSSIILLQQSPLKQMLLALF